MKSVNMEEFRTKSPDLLAGQLADLYQELFNLRFQLATGQIKQHSAVRRVKRQIARIKTVQRERALAAEK